MNEPELDALFVRFRDSGDPAALATLFDRTAPRLLALAARLVREPADAEDLLQTTFLAAIAAKSRYDATRPILGWLVGILQKQAATLHRKAARVAPRSNDEMSGFDEPLRVVLAAEEKTQLHRAIAELPERDREVIDLAVGASLGPMEIARRLGRTPGAIRVQMFRAIERLRQLLPAGLTASAFLFALESNCLASVRSTVVAASTAKSALIGGGVGFTASKLVGAVLLIGAVATTWIVRTKMAQDGVDSSVTAELPQVQDAPVAGPDSAGTATIAGATATGMERTVVEPFAPAVISDDVHRMTIVGTIDGVGVELDGASIVPVEQGDVILAWEQARARSGDNVAAVRSDVFGKDRIACSDDVRVRAITSVDPDHMPFTSQVSFSRSEAGARVFVVRRGTSLFVVGIATVRHDGELTKFDLVWRRVAQHTATEKSDVVRFDVAVLSDDWFERELTRRKKEYLAELDAHAEVIASSFGPISGFAVRACAFREAAGGVTEDDSFDYVSSTYSFEHDTRDDVTLTHNDWEVAFNWDRGAARVNGMTVADDSGRIFDLGVRDPSAFDPRWLEGALLVGRESFLRDGSLYFVETIDSETRRYDLMQILNIRPARDVVFRWSAVVDPAVVAAARKAIPAGPEDASRRYLTDGGAHIQMRAGAGGGNRTRAFLDGSTNQRIDTLSDRPIDLSGAIDSHEGACAYIEGGRIPDGKLWRITEVEWFATTVGDSNGHGAFRVVIGGETIAEVKQSAEESRATWTGEITLKPGDEPKAYVEIRNSSRCDVRIHGQLIDAAQK